MLELSGQGKGTSNVNYDYSAKTLGNLVCAHRNFFSTKSEHFKKLHILVNFIMYVKNMSSVNSVLQRFFFFFFSYLGKVCILESTKFTA